MTKKQQPKDDGSYLWERCYACEGVQMIDPARLRAQLEKGKL